MPLGSLSINSEGINMETKKVKDYLAIYFDRDVLLNNYDSWGKIKSEIEKLPTKIEITPFINEVMESILRINLVVNENDLKNVLKSAEYIENLIIPFKEIKGVPAIIFTNKNNSSDKLQIKIEWIPIHIINMVHNIKNINK